MRAGKPEIAANTAVCDSTLGSIPEAAIKYAKRGSYFLAPTKRRAAKNDMGDAFFCKR